MHMQAALPKRGDDGQEALALKARDDNLIAYAQQLEQLAAEASAHAERLSAKVQEPKD
jgi:hypothetical protein